jgi:actin-like ATPase involved in cell morphogenesis
MTYHLGIDLGTTYTAAAVARGGRAEAATLGTHSVAIPSVVYLAGDDLVVGEPAARRAVTEPQRVAREFKRRVGDPTPILLGGSPVAAELLMARTLAWVVGAVATTEGQAPASLSVTHPANWGEYKLDLLRQAVRHVGLTVDHLVPEPVAAATAYAAQRPLAPGTVVAVYDLGGGTFDAAVVRADEGGLRIIGRPDGIERLGGIDFDHAVFRHVLDAIGVQLDAVDIDRPGTAAALAQLRQECVAAKEALSSEADASIPVMLPDRHTEVRLTRSELEAMIRPALAETVVALRRAIASSGVAVDDVAAVLLVGGSSRIPLVSQLVTSDLGRPTAVDARPKEAIPVGAALVAMAAATGEEPGDRAGAAPAVVAVLPDSPSADAGSPSPSAGSPDSTVPMAGAAMAGPAAAPPARGSSEPAAPMAGVRATRLPPPPTRRPAPPAGPPAAAPPGGGAADPAPGGRAGGQGRRAAWLAAAAVVAAAGVAGALVLRDRGGDQAGGTSTSSTTAATVADPPDTSTPGTTADTDLDDLFGSGDPQDPLAPLPGDDWNEAARTQFVGDCADSEMGSMMALGGVDAASGCECVYDDLAGTVPFAEFNTVWTAEDIDPSDPTVEAMANTSLACAGISAG